MPIFRIEKVFSYPLKWGRWTFSVISTHMNQFTTETRFSVKTAHSQSLTGKLDVLSRKFKKKRKKSMLGLNISPTPPNDPPIRTIFVLCIWGGVTDVITHAKFHLNRFCSFGSPGGRNSPFPTGLENGS